MSENPTQDDEYIQYAQNLRMEWLKGEKEVDMRLLKVTDSLTITALSNKKIQADKTTDVANQEIQKEIIAILKKQTDDPFIVNNGLTDDELRLNVAIPTRKLNIDEDSVEPSSLEYTTHLK